MLIAINSPEIRMLYLGKERSNHWIPMVVVWVYGIMGLTGYELNSQTVTIGA